MRLARAVYSRASESRALHRPLDAIRSNPRVRAFARRHVRVLLARGTTWANVDGALRLLAEAPSNRVVFGPWEGDATTKVLYWAPFVRWAQEHFGLAPADVGSAVFPSAPVRALVEQYRSGVAPPRPLLKRARYERLQPPADALHGLVATWSEHVMRAVLSGVPTVAILPADGNVDEPDLDLAQRIAAEAGTSLTILRADALERLRHALR
jgi:hypothetical protein